MVVPDTATEPAIILFMVSGALVYVDEDGAFSTYEDGFTMLELAQEYYRSGGPDLSHVDAMIR